MLKDLFELSCKEISEEYVRLGHRLGWRFVTGPKANFSVNTEIAFISLNPGGDSDLPDHPKESSERGSAYLVEQWKGFPAGTEALQVQFKKLMEAVHKKLNVSGDCDSFINSKVLTAHFIPFRSKDLVSLHRSTESFQFGRKLWARIFQSLLPSIIITLNPETFDHIAALLINSGAKLLEHRQFQTGWGNYRAEGRKFKTATKVVTVIRFPHLSRYKLFSRQNCLPYVDEILGFVCSELRQQVGV